MNGRTWLSEPSFVHNTVVATKSEHSGGIGVARRGPEREEAGGVIVGHELSGSHEAKVRCLVLHQGFVLALLYVTLHPVREEVPRVASVVVDTGAIEQLQAVPWICHWQSLEAEKEDMAEILRHKNLFKTRTFATADTIIS